MDPAATSPSETSPRHGLQLPCFQGILKHLALQGNQRFCAILLEKPSNQNISAQSFTAGRKLGSASRVQTGKKKRKKKKEWIG